MLGVGDSEGSVQLWDVAQTKLVRTMHGHTDRITSLDWNQHILVSGGREGAIHMHDVRVAQHLVRTLNGHTQVKLFFMYVYRKRVKIRKHLDIRTTLDTMFHKQFCVDNDG